MGLYLIRINYIIAGFKYQSISLAEGRGVEPHSINGTNYVSSKDADRGILPPQLAISL